MSFDISESFQITHDSSLATIRLFTESHYFSPIEELDSVTSSIIIPRVLFQSNPSSKKKESQPLSKGKENKAQQPISNITSSTKNCLLPFLSDNHLCQSIEMEGSNSKIINRHQEEESNLLSSPQVHQVQYQQTPHVIRLFQESSIDEIPENSVHNIEIRFEESGKKSEDNNLFLSKGWGYKFASDQLEILKNNIQKLKKTLDGNSSQINNTVHPSNNKVQLFQKQFLKSNGLTTCEDKMLASIDAKSTKSQQIKNQQLNCARVISQFHNDFEANEQERQLQQQSKIINTTPKRRLNTSQYSSRKLMQRKMNLGLKLKERNSA